MDLKSYGVGDAVFSEGASWKRSHLLMRLRVVAAVAPSNGFIVVFANEGVAVPLGPQSCTTSY